MNILLVDDDRLGRVMLAESLRSRQLSIIEAESGEDAMQQWQRDRFDVVVSDILMPGMDGMELAASIRADEASGSSGSSGSAGPATRPVRLIALTASITGPDDEARIRGLFDVVLNKPITAELLFKALTSLQTPGAELRHP
ncbi:MAG: response regulator [Burkholderiaceae bacterium]